MRLLLVLLVLGGIGYLFGRLGELPPGPPPLEATVTEADTPANPTPVRSAPAPAVPTLADPVNGDNNLAANDVPDDPDYHYDAQEEFLQQDPIMAQTLAQEAEAGWHQRLAGLEQGFYTQPVDAPWSEPATTALLDSRDHPALADSEITHVDCRTNLCRVEAVHLDELARAVFRQYLPALVDDTVGARMIADDRQHPDDELEHSVIYLLRDGHEPL